MGNLADQVLKGETRAAARLMRLLDDEIPQAFDELKLLYPQTGRARIIGITGSPGSGKSTLTNRLIAGFRARGQSVGVVAIDPTSPFSGGAILGDRIRMQDHEADPGVFVRSLATRGNLGGLSRSTRNVVHVMDAMGKDIVIIETVGVGQDEVDIVGTAHTSLVVLVPGMGDDIQAIKAGILEIADVFVLNKADRDGVDRSEREIRMMIELGGVDPDGWKPPVARTVALRNEGIDELLEFIDGHQAWMADRGELAKRQKRAVEATYWESVKAELLGLAERRTRELGLIEQMFPESGEPLDPYTAAEQVVASLMGELENGAT